MSWYLVDISADTRPPLGSGCSGACATHLSACLLPVILQRSSVSSGPALTYPARLGRLLASGPACPGIYEAAGFGHAFYLAYAIFTFFYIHRIWQPVVANLGFKTRQTSHCGDRHLSHYLPAITKFDRSFRSCSKRLPLHKIDQVTTVYKIRPTCYTYSSPQWPRQLRHLPPSLLVRRGVRTGTQCPKFLRGRQTAASNGPSPQIPLGLRRRP